MHILQKFAKVRIKDIVSLFKLILATPFALVIKQFNKNLWLISERPNDARDNGYYLFKYIRENYPDKKVYYAIKTNSPDFLKIKVLGNYVSFGSLKHYIYYLLSDKNISTQIGTGEPGGQVCLNLEIMGIIKNKKIFLQHGVIKDILTFALYKNTKIRLFICGAEPEYNFVRENYGYPEGSVKYLGLCRFDGLHNSTINKRQILIMPTWRQWLNNDENTFLESEYFKTYQRMLNNKDFIKFLENNNFKAFFYPHDNVQQFINHFGSKSHAIILADKKNFDIQKLLKESALLITDYSSVFFDFAYMNKPTIYYQFDIKKYRENHYAEGYFKYESDSFGPICYTLSNIISCLNNYASRDFNINEEEKHKIRSFFRLHDDKNCERTFEEIKKT